MIVSCLIRRVEVYRDYRLHIDFNIDFEQFSAGLDISAIAAYHHLWLTMSKSFADRQPQGACGRKVQPVLSSHPHYP